MLYFLPERSGESDTLLDHYNLELLMHAGAQDYKHEVEDLLDYADSRFMALSHHCSLLCLPITLIV